MKLEITITGINSASSPDLPSHLFPGAGSGGATFRVTAGVAPAWSEMSDLLARAVADAHLVHYEDETGEGYFVVVDGDAPEYGAVVKLAGDDVSPAARQAEVSVPPVAYPLVSIEHYYDDLDRHDWYFSFSDDSRVYNNGKEDMDRLRGTASHNGQDHEALYQAFHRHYFSGEPWGSQRWDKPIRPVDGVLILPPEPVSSAPESRAPDMHAPVDATTSSDEIQQPAAVGKAPIVEETGKGAGVGQLPGWTLAVNLGGPLVAVMVAMGCRALGVSWWVGVPIAAAIVVGGLLWERSIERKYLSARRCR